MYASSFIIIIGETQLRPKWLPWYDIRLERASIRLQSLGRNIQGYCLLHQVQIYDICE